MSTPASKIHPLVAIAAASVVVVSLAGTAALMGWLPGRNSDESPSTQTSAPSKEAAAVPGAAATPPANSATPADTASSSAPTAAPKHKSTTSTANHPAKAPQSAPSAAATPAPVPVQAASVCQDCGKVVAVRTVEQAAPASGVGAVAGAVVGGVLGNQVGGGTGKTLATVAGAVGGGYAGNEIEKRSRKHITYVVEVQMQTGARQSFSFEQPPSWREGDSVRVVNGTLVAR